jgi:hypothetical protein
MTSADPSVVSATQSTAAVASFLIFADGVQAACTGILKGAGKQVRPPLSYQRPSQRVRPCQRGDDEACRSSEDRPGRTPDRGDAPSPSIRPDAVFVGRLSVARRWVRCRRWCHTSSSLSDDPLLVSLCVSPCRLTRSLSGVCRWSGAGIGVDAGVILRDRRAAGRAAELPLQPGRHRPVRRTRHRVLLLHALHTRHRGE